MTHLRVYEPLEAFTPAARRLWTRTGEAQLDATLPAHLERREAWRQVIAGPQATEPAGGTGVARVLVRDGSLYVCPLQLRERWTVGVRVVTQTLPPIVVALALGRAVATAAETTERVPTRLRTLAAAWSIPLEWLVLVTPQEREGERYLVPMARARARGAGAARTLRARLGSGGLVEEVDAVTGWLGEFHPRSWVELDDGPVARLVDGDDAVEDVRMGLESLAAGDTTSVAAAYRRLRRRTERLAALSRAS